MNFGDLQLSRIAGTSISEDAIKMQTDWLKSAIVSTSSLEADVINSLGESSTEVIEDQWIWARATVQVTDVEHSLIVFQFFSFLVLFWFFFSFLCLRK